MRREILSLAMVILAILAAFGVIVACFQPSTIRSLHFWIEDAR